MAIAQSSLTPGTRKSAARRAAEARGFDPIAQARQRAIIAREQHASAASHSPDAFKEFAQQVALATNGPVLRYSHRLHLLELAQRGGINRFDANLIIAAIEHRAAKNRPRATHAPRNSSAIAGPANGARLFWSALTVQAMIVLGTWIALLH